MINVFKFQIICFEKKQRLRSCCWREKRKRPFFRKKSYDLLQDFIAHVAKKVVSTIEAGTISSLTVS